MKPLYLAPMNFFSNYFFRHFAILQGADFVFSELIMIDRLDDEIKKGKLNLLGDDLSKTIFQIGARNKDEILLGVKTLKKYHPNINEINLNAGCPQSTMQRMSVCSGLLFNLDNLFEVSKKLVIECEKINCISSVKIRVGTSPEKLMIKKYLSILKSAGIKKVYIHGRTLKYNYTQPAIYDSFKDLKKEFSEIELIFNGDVDSYKRYTELINLGADGVMLGRVALSNPEIFTQIKNKQEVKKDFYDPFLNDPNLDFSSGIVLMNTHKINLIKEFILLAEKNNVSLLFVKKHLQLLTKGLSFRKKIDLFLREAKSFDDLDKFEKLLLNFKKDLN